MPRAAVRTGLGLLTEAQRAIMDAALAELAAERQERASAAQGGGGAPTAAGIPHEPLPRARSRKLAPGASRGRKGDGSWGSLLRDADAVRVMDRDDPNYDSEQDGYTFESPGTPAVDAIAEHKEAVGKLVEEYFSSADIGEAAARLEELRQPAYGHFFVKKAVTMALDRPPRAREMTAALLSALFPHVLQPGSLTKGFLRLLEAAEDLSLDVPNAAEELGVFLARAVVDDIVPPAFVASISADLVSDNEKGREAVRLAQAHLSVPHPAERVLRHWADGAAETADGTKARMAQLLQEFTVSGDAEEAARRLRELKVPFYHHEFVKKALTLAIEAPATAGPIIKMLCDFDESGLISSDQVVKGFERVDDAAQDLELDVPGARARFDDLCEAARNASLLPRRSLDINGHFINGGADPGEPTSTVEFKKGATALVLEYFAAADVGEAAESLAELDGMHGGGNCHHFVKRAVTCALDRDGREKEMVCALFSALYPSVIGPAAMGEGFALLLKAVADLTLDIPDAPGTLALFLARAVVDDILPPAFLEGAASVLKDTVPGEVVTVARATLAARHASERVLRVWGGGAAGTVAHTKESMATLLQEFAVSGDANEAARSLRELKVPFYHHEFVKKALTLAIEAPGTAGALTKLLADFGKSGLLTSDQVAKGFARMHDYVEDLELDVPGARGRFDELCEQARPLPAAA